jgi:uncharacterized protein
MTTELAPLRDAAPDPVAPHAPRDGICDVGVGWRHPHYGELLERAQAPIGSAGFPYLDFLEVHSENFFGEGGAALAVLTQARAHWPISLHGVGLGLGSATGVDSWHLDQLARLVKRVDPVRVSDHACFARGRVVHAEYGEQMVHASDLLPVPFTQEALDVMCSNVHRVQERLERALLVENLSAYVGFASSDMTEAQFLSGLVQRTGSQLLLDVNNIYVNALNRQLAGATEDPVQACCAWLDQIAVGAVGQLHVAGHCAMDDIVIDDHSRTVAEPVWQIYRHAIARFGLVPTLVEWDTDIPPLDELLGQAELARQHAHAVLKPPQVRA